MLFHNPGSIIEPWNRAKHLIESVDSRKGNDMKDLKTIGELELLEAARHTILKRWIDRAGKQISTTDKMIANMYWEQVEELEERIDELRAAE